MLILILFISVLVIIVHPLSQIKFLYKNCIYQLKPVISSNKHICMVLALVNYNRDYDKYIASVFLFYFLKIL